MSKRREVHPADKQGDEKFFKDRQQARGEVREDFRPDPNTKSPPDLDRRREATK